jgi:tRNA threonylcarbamoyladenosine biosynthesis protein TsaB
MEQILLIDTSTDICAVGLARDGELLNFLVKEDCKLQSAIIHHLIDEIMKSTSTQLEDLSAVAVCSGPGSYTGLRIGMAVAKGLCYALQKPLIANHKLELLAQQKIQVNGDYWQYGVVLTARTDEY